MFDEEKKHEINQVVGEMMKSNPKLTIDQAILAYKKENKIAEDTIITPQSLELTSQEQRNITRRKESREEREYEEAIRAELALEEYLRTHPYEESITDFFTPDGERPLTLRIIDGEKVLFDGDRPYMGEKVATKDENDELNFTGNPFVDPIIE